MQTPLFDTLLRIIGTLPAVEVLEARRPDGPVQEAVLRIACPPEVVPDLSEFLRSPGALAAAAPTPDGFLLVAPDGAMVVTTLVVTPDTKAPTGVSPEGTRFWGALCRALGAVGREEPFTAHGHLELCRTELLALYRLALAPGQPGGGWWGLEGITGAERPLQSLTEWLVCPLDVRLQWRCAHKLAAAYEGLTLPLAERLGAPYPWELRNHAFRMLDSVRPAQPAPEAVIPAEPDPAPAHGGPARFKVKMRRKAD